MQLPSSQDVCTGSLSQGLRPKMQIKVPKVPNLKSEWFGFEAQPPSHLEVPHFPAPDAVTMFDLKPKQKITFICEFAAGKGDRDHGNGGRGGTLGR